MILPLKSSSYIIVLASIFISSSLAVPIQQQQRTSFQVSSHSTDRSAILLINKIPSASYLENYSLFKDLDEYYNTIVNQVVQSTINEIIETAPETYLTIHELQLIGRDYCRTSLRAFMQVLEYQLNHQVKDNLLASVRPLIDNHYHKELTMLELNSLISQQLGFILNPNEISNNIIKQIYQQEEDTSAIARFWKLYTDKKWAQTLHHERNESIALEAWLRSWLMDIEFILKDEFDSNISSSSSILL